MQKNMLYKCIVVEDEAPIRRNIVRKINELDIGFTVTGEAMDGEIGMKLIENDIPHLVITDIQMPVMDGIELVKRIYFAYPSIKVIILSGYDEFSYAQQAIKYEVKEYLLKPVSLDDLRSSLVKVKMLLDSDLSNFSNCEEQNISPEEIVRLIELYIHKNYRNNLSIADIAENLHFSADYLSRIYKKCTGQSPLKYLITLRINEAKQILSSDADLSMKSVGKLVGYEDQYYFSRMFKKYTGYYPSEYKSSRG